MCVCGDENRVLGEWGRVSKGMEVPKWGALSQGCLSGKSGR